MNIIDPLSELFNNSHLSSKLFKKLVAAVLKKLEACRKDEIALSSITLLKIIKKKVEVTNEFGLIVLWFLGKFLTQSTKVNSHELFLFFKWMDPFYVSKPCFSFYLEELEWNLKGRGLCGHDSKLFTIINCSIILPTACKKAILKQDR